MQSESVNNIYPTDYALAPNLNYIDEYANRVIKDKLWAVAEYTALALRYVGGMACGGMLGLLIGGAKRLIKDITEIDNFKPLQLIYYNLPHANCGQIHTLTYYPVESVSAKLNNIRGVTYGIGGLLAFAGLGAVVSYGASVVQQLIINHRKNLRNGYAKLNNHNE
ncbi:hypothetical protein E24_00371 [Faustovirus]|nr:hypothetical protein PRJ_Fausto_00349 [Faustovirus]AMN83287.1 hypothetical protein E24_00371 [Faustovirus]AMN84272.1 hypothetical protein D5a_00370 [Faustovirus]AMN85258.1 hypothetical protein E23_00371 [Faustovirus]QBR99256.1 hypothetical protein [Faustovirus mariensis]